MPRPPTSKSPPRARREAAKAAKAAPVPARIARRERRRDRSREEIVDAARRVLLKNGIAATTLAAVAKEVGLTKTALYYYYPSKDALLFEICFGVIEAQSRNIHAGVAMAANGGEALRAIIRESVATFAARPDDFRLTFLHPQVVRPGSLHVDPEQIARIRPLNELAYAGAAKLLADEAANGRGRAGVEPRLMAFLANVAAIGLLTMKGMVESFGDPLRYSDDELVEGLAQIFEAAARP